MTGTKSLVHMNAARAARRRTLLGGCAALSVMLLPRPGGSRAAGAQRIVSVGGALTEIVYRLGAQGALVATDTTSLWPEPAKALPKVGYMRTLSAEGVMSMQPTVILAPAEAGPATVLQQLQSAGVRIVRAHNEHTFDSLLANVALVAEAIDRRREGDALAAELKRDWSATRAKLAGRPAPKVLFILSHAANNVQVAGGSTAAESMITLAGGANAMTGFAGYKPLSAESALAAAPDVILVTREGLEAVGGVDALLTRPGLALTPAGKSRRFFALEALYLLGFGPRLPQAVAELARGIGTVA